MKKLVSFILALTLCLGLCVPASAAEFSDVPDNHAFRDAINWCASQGIIGGYNDGTFKPANTVTRSNFVVMLTRAFYANEIDASYVDAAEGTFAPNYLVVKNHRTLANSGFDYVTLKPDKMNVAIDRYSMAQLMTNIMTERGFSASDADKTAAIAKITDYNNIPNYHRDAVTNVYALGVIGGYPNGSFSGEATMNRGQAAVVIYRMIQKMYPDGELPTASTTTPVNTGNSELVDPSTGTTMPTEPTTTDTNTGKTLVDGSAITEENVMRLMEAKIAEWGNKPWGVWHDDFIAREKVYPEGDYGDVRKTTDNYKTTSGMSVSCASGCGGWATYLSDAAFGNTGFPLHKIANADDVRAGDIVILLRDGKIYHIAVASGKDTVNDYGSYTVTNHGLYETNAGAVPGHSPNGINMHTRQTTQFTTNYDSMTGYSAVIYTRYPD